MTVKENHNVSLVCKGKGNPKPTITWIREDYKNILFNNNGSKGIDM